MNSPSCDLLQHVPHSPRYAEAKEGLVNTVTTPAPTLDCPIFCPQASEFWELGIEPMPVSAISGTGTGEMLDALVKSLPPPRSLEQVEGGKEPLAIAIVGRPNVGENHMFSCRIQIICLREVLWLPR